MSDEIIQPSRSTTRIHCASVNCGCLKKRFQGDNNDPPFDQTGFNNSPFNVAAAKDTLWAENLERIVCMWHTFSLNTFALGLCL